MEELPIRNHIRKVRAYWIISRVFIPLGIVCAVLGTVLLAISVPFFAQAIQEAENSGDCVITETSIRCGGAIGMRIAWSAIGLSFGISHLILAIPFLIIGPIFRVKAKQNRAIDERNGVDYGDAKYGK